MIWLKRWLTLFIIGFLYACGGVGNIQATLFYASDTTIENCIRDLELNKTLLDMTTTTIYRSPDSAEKVRFIVDDSDTLGFNFGTYSVAGVDSATKSLLILTYYGKLGNVMKSNSEISYFAKRKCLKVFNKNVIEKIGENCKVKFENNIWGNWATFKRMVVHD
jgi:hypothetical protein